MASGDGGSAFLGFVVGAMVVVVALVGAAIYTGTMTTERLHVSIDTPRPTIPSQPR